MERSLSPRWKYLAARRGGSIWITSHPWARHWLVSAVIKPCTAPVCSMFLSSWPLLLPETLRQSEGALCFSSEALHRLLAVGAEVRSLRQSRASPLSVRVSRPRWAAERVARPNPSSRMRSWDARGPDTPVSPRRSLRTSQGQSERMSRVRFSRLASGRRAAGGREGCVPLHPRPMSSGIETRAGMGSLGGGAAPAQAGQRIPQVEDGGRRGQTPDGIAGAAGGRLALQGQER